MRNDLPLPSPEALELSAQLAARLHALIAAEGGWISFARFMHEALYAPGLGYYAAGSRKLGAEGDFITAPEISPLFGRSLAAQVAQVLQCAGGDVLEVGAGSGLLACDLLQALAQREALPQRYRILEVSPELRARQQQTLAQRVPQWLARVEWLDDLPASITGCVVANELLDAMPVHRLVWRAEGVFERGVVAQAEGGFAWQDRPAAPRLQDAALAVLPQRPEGEVEYVSELGLAARDWVANCGARLQRGALLLIDYGYPAAAYYLPERAQGTLQAYYRHRAHNDVLRWPGLQDITSFVDFSAMAASGEDAGLAVAGFIDQGNFLLQCGLLDLLAAVDEPGSEAYVRASRAALRLFAPHEMGELFKVLALSRGIDAALLGFQPADRRFSL